MDYPIYIPISTPEINELKERIAELEKEVKSLKETQVQDWNKIQQRIDNLMRNGDY